MGAGVTCAHIEYVIQEKADATGECAYTATCTRCGEAVMEYVAIGHLVYRRRLP